MRCIIMVEIFMGLCYNKLSPRSIGWGGGESMLLNNNPPVSAQGTCPRRRKAICFFEGAFLRRMSKAHDHPVGLFLNLATNGTNRV